MGEAGMVHVLGVDGCRGGWVGVRSDDDDDGELAVLVAPSLAELCAMADPVAVIAVDMPIGLTAEGRRRCDDEVRPLLGPRRSSLFSPPALPALAHHDHATANEWSKTELGRGISIQAWMLVPKIREARQLAATRTLHEAFPELAFAAMNDGRPLADPKRTPAGAAARQHLLADHGLAVDVADRPRGVAVDDLLDAAALAWSARRIGRGDAECRPVGLSPGEPAIWW